MMKPNTDHLFDLAYLCPFDTDWLLGSDVVEAAVSFMNPVAGLPNEELDKIHEFIGDVRERRRIGRRSG